MPNIVVTAVLLLRHSEGSNDFTTIAIIAVALFFLIVLSKGKVKKSIPRVRKKRKTLDEARAEGMKEGISIERENKTKEK